MENSKRWTGIVVLVLSLALALCIGVYGNQSTTFFTVVLAMIFMLWLFKKKTRHGGFESIDQSEKDKLFVVVVGAGFSGICAAVQLRLRNIPFVVLEGASSIGGTWWYNKYPGCACDLPGLWYSYSFYKHKSSRFIPLQSETLSYLKEVCRHFGINDFIKLNTKVLECSFDDEKKNWIIKTANGEEVACTHLVSAIGGLTIPRYPDIPGIEDFQGDRIHTARWPAGYDLSGKRVGVIGTGASATQLISNIVDQVKELTVFQRSAAWVVQPASAMIAAPKSLSKYQIVNEFITRFNRTMLFISGDLMLKLIMTNGRLSRWLKGVLQKDMIQQVEREDVKRKIIPSTEIATKRLIVNNQYLPSFNNDHVKLVDQGIMKITQHGVTTTDRSTHDFDTIVFATGFDSLNSMKGLRILRNGASLSQSWDDCPNAYNGVMYPGFPNLFILLGPNTILGKFLCVRTSFCFSN